ncbi:MAG: Wzz/FepE/Etk N-terminal domain-containing protein [Colwellia sp.]
MTHNDSNSNIEMPAELLQSLQYQSGNEVDLLELWRAIWSGKWLIIAITSLFAVGSVFYALSLPNVYKSEALLAPAEQDSGGLGGVASQLGGLASLAGVNLGGGGGIDKTELALKIMTSRAFVNQFIDKHQLLVPLMASKNWHRDTNELIIDNELYDKEKRVWVRKIKAPFKPQPSPQEAYKEFEKIISVTQDKTSSMVTISIEHYSPQIARQWVKWLVEEINLEMKTRDLREAQKSIKYLEEQLSQTKVYELQKSML